MEGEAFELPQLQGVGLPLPPGMADPPRRARRLTIENAKLARELAQGRLVVEIELPDATVSERFEFDPYSTVDYVKIELFRRCAALRRLSPSDYYLALPSKEGEDPVVLFIEFVKFIWCHDSIHTAVMMKQAMHMQLIEKEPFTEAGKKRQLLAKTGEPSIENSTGEEEGNSDSPSKALLRQTQLEIAESLRLNGEEQEAEEEKEKEATEKRGLTVEEMTPEEMPAARMSSSPPHALPQLTKEEMLNDLKIDFSGFDKILDDFTNRIDSVVSDSFLPLGDKPLARSLNSVDDILKSISKSGSKTSFPVTVSVSDQDFSMIVPCEKNMTPKYFIDYTIDRLERLVEELKSGSLIMVSENGKHLLDPDDDTPIYEYPNVKQQLEANQLPSLTVAKRGSEPIYQQSYPFQEKINPETGMISSLSIPPKSKGNISLAFQRSPAASPLLPRNKKEKLMELQIGSLIGQPLCWTSGEDEVNRFRKNMESLFKLEGMDVLDRRFFNVFSAAVGNATNEPEDQKIHIRFNFPGGRLVRTFNCDGQEKISSLVERVITSAQVKNGFDASVKPQNLCVKISGQSSYVLRDTKLIELDVVRECMKRRMMVSVALEDFTEAKERGLKELIDIAETEKFREIPREDIVTEAEEDDSSSRKFIPFSEIHRPLELRVVCLEDIDFHNLHPALTDSDIESKDGFNLFVTIGLYHGGVLIAPEMSSKSANSLKPLWCEWLRSTIQICDIPRETRMCVTLKAVHPSSLATVPLGWISVTLLDYKDQLRTGVLSLNLWPGEEANPIACVPNYEFENPIKLVLELYRFPHPVLFRDEDDKRPEYRNEDKPRREELRGLMEVIKKDPLYVPDADQKKLLWTYRYWCRNTTKALPKVLMAVDWTKTAAVQEAHRMLKYWKPLPPEEAMELLDAKFADRHVRHYAVQRLSFLPDTELVNYLPQLTQVLKYEPYHDSALARLLLSSALRSRCLVGHALFWHLQAELQNPVISERYTLLLEVYLRGCGKHREELIKQLEAGQKLSQIAAVMKKTPLKERPAVLKKELSNFVFPASFITPMNPRLVASELVPEACKAMDSLTVPLFMTFKNKDRTDEETIQFIFKAGDDLRQDIITLQMMGLMDKIWKRNGLDLHMSVYGCTATGSDIGFIEVVKRSETTATIQKAAGGAKQAFSKTPLTNWLRKHNPTPEKYAFAVENFILSCAGYCVATFVLGLGDRHNDNIMLTKEGNMFHIDFAHWLGNMMEWKGFKRETAPFVFTPQFAHIMGGIKSSNFQRFVSLCCSAYLCLRNEASLFIVLFQLMLSTGIEQLKTPQDIMYLREAFQIEKNDEEAAEYFTKLIHVAYKTKRTQFNEAIHILAHPNKEKEI